MITRPEERGIPRSQIIRKYPATTNLKNGQRKSLELLLSDYMKFLKKCKTPQQTTNEIIKRIENKGIGEKKYKTKPFYIINEDKNCLALVKPGVKNLEEGINVIVSHIDSPCLVVKPRPLLFEWDPDLKELHPGVRIDTTPYGGILPHQWSGRPVDIIGYIIRNGRRRNISFSGIVSDVSAHLDQRDGETNYGDAHDIESIDIFTGHESRKAMLDYLRFKSEDDFARAQLYAVPQTQVQMLSNYFVIGYGHDDKAGTFAAIDSMLRAKPHYTTIFFAFDKEEVGSHGTDGAAGRFFEYTLHNLLDYFSHKIKGEGKLTKLLYNSRCITMDVTVGSTSAEMEEKEIDERNIARLGYGAALSIHKGMFDENDPSPRYIDFLMKVSDRRKVRIQAASSGEKADKHGDGMGSMSTFFSNRGIPSIDMGPPIGHAHGPAELLHGGDLYWAREFCKAFIENKIPFRN